MAWGAMLSDSIFFIGLGGLTFLLMASWSVSVARAANRPISKQRLLAYAGFCALMTVTFVAIDLLHLGPRLFGWMTR